MKSPLFKKYGKLIIAGLLICWTLITPSHFQKGGIDSDIYTGITIFIAVISLLILSVFNTMDSKSIVFVFLPYALISLIFTSLILGPAIVAVLYGDKTWFLSEMKHRIFINSIYYGMNAAILILLSKIHFEVKRRLRSRA